MDYYNYTIFDFELFRANAQQAFGGILAVNQMWLNQDRAGLPFTTNGGAAYLDSEARALSQRLRDYLETL